jgi:VIT1/CCC1 family predicted Fe2+/Mn2+ transporter
MATNGETKLAVLDASYPTTVPEPMESGGAAKYDDALSPPSRQGQWLRAAVLGASDGLVSTSALMLGIGAARPADPRAALLSGVAGLVAGACSMAIGEFVSVHAQLDVELAGLKRVEEARGYPVDRAELGLPNPSHAAAASALSFAAGAAIPLLAAWFVSSYTVRVAVVVATATMALAVFGALGALQGGAPAGRAGLRAAVGGLVAMGITYGLMKLF